MSVICFFGVNIIANNILKSFRFDMTSNNLFSLTEGTKNLISNLPSYAKSRSLNCLKSNYPIIVCGAGPSLNDSISLLKTNRKYFFLLAVDTAYATLSAHKIKPDAILILEAQQINLNDFIFNIDRSIPIIADLTSSTAVLRNFLGPKFFFVSKDPVLN